MEFKICFSDNISDKSKPSGYLGEKKALRGIPNLLYFFKKVSISLLGLVQSALTKIILFF